MVDISRFSCSIMLWRRTCFRSRILMATLLPLFMSLANFTFAKLPSPMVFPNSYFPITIPPFATFALIFSFFLCSFLIRFLMWCMCAYEAPTCLISCLKLEMIVLGFLLLVTSSEYQ